MQAHANDFRWNAANRDNLHRHGLTVEAVEHVVRNAKRPYPRHYGRKGSAGRRGGGWQVIGRTPTRRLVMVLYIIDQWDHIYVYHAM